MCVYVCACVWERQTWHKKLHLILRQQWDTAGRECRKVEFLTLNRLRFTLTHTNAHTHKSSSTCRCFSWLNVSVLCVDLLLMIGSKCVVCFWLTLIDHTVVVCSFPTHRHNLIQELNLIQLWRTALCGPIKYYVKLLSDKSGLFVVCVCVHTFCQTML